MVKCALRKHWPLLVDWMLVAISVALLLHSTQWGLHAHPLLAIRLQISHCLGLGASWAIACPCSFWYPS